MGAGPKVKCLCCGDIMQSMFRHDYKGCTCYRESSKKVDRCAAVLVEKLGLDEDQHHLARCYLSDEFATGITVDGGSYYLGMNFTRNSGHEIIKD